MTNTAPTFTVGDGMFTPPISPELIRIQADGKVLLEGRNSGNFIAFARYTTAGVIDTSFSGDGVFVTNFSASYNLAAPSREFLLQSDGKFLLLTDTNQVLRFNTDGTIDNTFSGDGLQSISFGDSTTSIESMSLQTDGKIVVAGSTQVYKYDPVFTVVSGYFAVARLNSDGTFDSSFSNDGKLESNLVFNDHFDQGQDLGGKVAIQKDGKIVVAGGTEDGSEVELVVVRYNTDGSLDTSFGVNGISRTSGLLYYPSIFDIAISSNGKIFVTGSDGGSHNQFVLRFNENGSLDTNFNQDGIATIGATGRINIIGISNDEKITVSGSSSLVRLDASGNLDSSFATNGITKLETSIYADQVAIQSDGTMLGWGDGRLFHFNTDGSLLNTDYWPSNSLPSNTLDANPTYTERSTPIILDGNVKIYDQELSASNFAGASLTISRSGGVNPEDVLGIKILGAGFSASGNSLTYNNSSLATYSVSDGLLAISFMSGATNDLVNQVLQRITYANTSHTPPSFVNLEWSFSDGNTGTQGSGDALVATGVTNVNITAIKEPPIVANPIPDQQAFAGSTFTYQIPNNTFYDPDSTYLLYTAQQANSTGNASGNLPSWLHFDSDTRTFTGIPSYYSGGLELNVYVGVYDGLLVSSDTFKINVSRPLEGTPDNDDLSGTSLAEVVDGGLGNDTIYGFGGEDVLSGNDGDDILSGGSGNDVIDGGNGNDQVVFSGNRANYTITKTTTGSTVTDNVGSEGTDTLSNIESMVFADQVFFLITKPILSTFAEPIANGNEDTTITISFNAFLAKSDAGDLDGTVDAFVIKALSSGSLKIGTSLDTAIAWGAGNTAVGIGENAYWTPDANANGPLDAFTVVAEDNEGLESSIPVQAQVSVTAVNDPATFSGDKAGILSKTQSTPVSGTLHAADPDGSDEAKFVTQTSHPGIYGIFNLDASGAWTYNLNTTASAVVALKAGQILLDTLNTETVGRDKQSVTFEIFGAADATTAGDDKSNTGNGDNNIDAGNGNNEVTSGTGDDTINKEGGNDTINAGNGNNTINAGGGKNKITSGTGADSIDAGNGSDTINAGDGNNVINAGSGNNKVTSGTGDDSINTEGGSDTINAGNGNNTINAGGGNDKIITGVGNDIIIGGAGADKMTGGAGHDHFIFNTLGSGVIDKITDFNAAEDVLVFDDAVFIALAGGISAANLVVGAKTMAHDSNVYLVFDTSKHTLYYDADGNGIEAAVAIVTLTGVNTLDNTNFSVI